MRVWLSFLRYFAEYYLLELFVWLSPLYSTIIEQVYVHMDICKNELTSPFKIPLRDKEKSKGSPAVATRYIFYVL